MRSELRAANRRPCALITKGNNMTVLEIFEKVNIKTPVEQRLFFNYLNDSVNEIGQFYGDMPHTVFNANITADIVPIAALTDEMVLLPLYHNAVVDNILFLCGQGDTYTHTRASLPASQKRLICTTGICTQRADT